MTKNIISIVLVAGLLFGCTYFMSGCSLFLFSALNFSPDGGETVETPETVYDEDGKISYEKIEYKRSLITPNEEFESLSSEVTDAYWKYYRIGDGILGPSSAHVCGFFIISENKTEEIEAKFTFEETEIVFPKGIDPEITGLEDFKWGYSEDFSRRVTGTWIGYAYYDMNNKIIYLDASQN